MTLHNAADLSRHLSKLGSAVQRGQQATLDEAARKAVALLKAGAIKPDTLSHWGRGRKKGGYHVGAKAQVTEREAVVTPVVRPLAGLLERGSERSGTTWKAPRRRGAPRRKRGTVGSYTREAVPARHAWSNGIQTIEPIIAKEMAKKTQNIVKGAFNG